ncbi:D-alanyl-D-alanine carboxypeptidase/D-alanyl-D-alanine endopeptidase [Oryzihumus sp.]|uniref:D-alanyl-D-alanine carboxypeptidase/D-alanyl-D-alanine endopeptidase n=1 Tax=Oryzihumus sp. TaxID=1968903 RepID=UPI002EDB7801
MRRQLGVAAAVVALLAGYVTLDVHDVVPGLLTEAAPRSAAAGMPGGRPTPSPSPIPSVAVPVAPASAAGPLPEVDSLAPAPTAQGLLAAVNGRLHDPRLGRQVSVTIRDGLTGGHLLDLAPEVPRAPASTAKLLTAAAIARAADLSQRMTTKVVQGAGPADLVLVAGGDMLLGPGNGNPDAVAGRAGLLDLARQVATAVHEQGLSSVRLGLDDTWARGPAYAPGWLGPDIDLGLTGAVATLGLSSQRATSGHPAPADPAVSAATALAGRLRALGLTVAPAVTRTTARAGAAVLGQVESATLGELLSLALADSDNALTESLARQVAVRTGHRPDFPTVAAWVLASLRARGISVAGVRLVDSSGLSRGTTVPAGVIGDVLTLASRGKDPGLEAVVAALPVAGLTGTLHDRFHTPATRVAAGIARAKTGTLTGVSSLAGTVVDRDGRLLTFVVLADAVPPGGGTLNARAALDAFVATLATCGCR